MKIVFIVQSLTDLRYLVPFSIATKRSIPDIEQTFLFSGISSKYNGLARSENDAIARQIISSHCSVSHEYDPDVIYDVAVFVEVSDFSNCKKKISLQHGFDCVPLSKRIISDSSAYVCASEMMRIHAENQGIVNAITSPFPVAFWSFENVQYSNCVTVFYPDLGDNELASSIIDMILDHGIDVYVKQRKKHQKIKSRGTQVYDSIWYPSECMVLPASSCFTIGFGSSAYIDLVPLGINYINVDIHSESYPWNHFVHPIADNYVRITDIDKALSEIHHCLSTMQHVTPTVNDEQISEFIIKLLQRC